MWNIITCCLTLLVYACETSSMWNIITRASKRHPLPLLVSWCWALINKNKCVNAETCSASGHWSWPANHIEYGWWWRPSVRPLAPRERRMCSSNNQQDRFLKNNPNMINNGVGALVATGKASNMLNSIRLFSGRAISSSRSTWNLCATSFRNAHRVLMLAEQLHTV